MNEPAQTQIGSTQPATAKETYINLKGALQAIWEQFRETFPNAAEAFAERLLALLEREPSWLGAAADVNVGMPDVLVPKSVVEKALQGMWEDFCEAYPEAAKALAKTLVTHNDPKATDGWFSWTNQVMAAIPDILDKFAQPADPAPTSSDSQGPSHSDEVAIAADTKHAPGDDDASQQPATDDGEDVSPEQVAIAADTKHAPGDDDASRQPATDDDQDASQEAVARAWDDEDARSDYDASQQPATDDDQEASQEQVAIASDPEDVPADDVDVVEPASAEAVIDPTLGDQAGLAASAPVIPDDGFSFSAFPKPGVPVEVATAAMPAEQLSHEDILDSGTPESDSTHHDAGSQDVGNAAPNKEHVVHHGDLAP
jgi:hypothetical protein